MKQLRERNGKTITHNYDTTEHIRVLATTIGA